MNCLCINTESIKSSGKKENSLWHWPLQVFLDTKKKEKSEKNTSSFYINVKKYAQKVK